MWARVGNDLIRESRTIKLLGITIDNKLKFDVHISNICKKAQRKLTILMRLKKYLDFEKLRILFKTFFEFQFKYCPLTWMFYSRSTNNKINKLQERAPSFVYDHYSSSFDVLLKQDKSFTIHHYKIQILCIELYKICNNLSQTVFTELFTKKENPYNLRSQLDFTVPKVKTVYKSFNSLRYFGPKIWNLVPTEIKYCDSLENFTSKIRQWKPDSCPCRLCKNFIPNVGF